MAGTVLGSLFSKSGTSFSSDQGVTMWRGVQVVRVTLSPEAEVTNNPVQVTVVSAAGTDQQADLNQGTIALELGPYKIITSTKVEVELFCSTIDMLVDLITSFRDDTILMNMVSKSAVIKNLAMVRMNIANNPRVMNATRVTISFEQAPPKRTDAVQAEQDADENELGVGTVSPVSGSASFNEVLARVMGREL